MARKGSEGFLAHQDPKDLRDLGDRMEKLELLVILVLLDLKDFQVQLDLMERLDKTGLLETRDLQVLKEIKEESDHLVHKGLPVPRDHPDLEERTEAMDSKDTLVRQATLALMATQVHQQYLESQEMVATRDHKAPMAPLVQPVHLACLA